MAIKEFIEKIHKGLEFKPETVLEAQSQFKNLPQWSSMYNIMLIAVFDEEFDIMLTGEDITASATMNDLFQIYEERKDA